MGLSLSFRRIFQWVHWLEVQTDPWQPFVEEQIKIGKKQNGPDFGKILPFKSETEIEEFFSVPQYNQLIEDHIRKAIKGDDLLAQRGLKKIYQEDYVIQTAYADIPEEITNLYMKIAQEDKSLLAKWGTKKEIKKLVLKRYSEFRKRIIKKMKLWIWESKYDL